MADEHNGVFVYNTTKETFLALRVKVADTLVGRLVGLLGKRRLPVESGVWIMPCNSIHTIGMLFSIDVVMLDKDNRVVGLREQIRPFSVTRPNLRAESVLELPPHTIFRSRTEVGDQLLVDSYDFPQSVSSQVSSAPFEQADGKGHAKRSL